MLKIVSTWTNSTVAFMETARERMKGQTMAHHSLELVRQGRTSLAEALRIGVGAGHES